MGADTRTGRLSLAAVLSAVLLAGCGSSTAGPPADDVPDLRTDAEGATLREASPEPDGAPDPGRDPKDLDHDGPDDSGMPQDGGAAEQGEEKSSPPDGPWDAESIGEEMTVPDLLETAEALPDAGTEALSDDWTAALSCLNPPAGPPPGTWFPVGVWYHWVGADGNEAHDRAYYEASFKDLAAHGINLAVAVFVFGQDRVWLLEEAEKQGVKVIMGMGEMTALLSQPYVLLPALADPLAADQAGPIKDLPGLFGYYIADEPDIHNVMPVNLFVAKEAFLKADPAHASYATLALLNEMTEYFLVMQPDVLMTDKYPLYKVITWPAAFAGGLHIQDFLAHIETAKTIAGAKPVWLVVQAFENLLQWRMPAFEEMTAMVYLALNRDVRGLVYFLYQSVPTGENLQGLVDLAGQPTANWSQMAAFHQQLEPVRNAILWSQKIAPFASAAFPVDVGCFQHQLGFRYVLAANREVTAATATTVSIPTSLLPGVTAVFDEVTGEQLPLASSPDGVSVSLSLGPGGGRMLRVCTGE